MTAARSFPLNAWYAAAWSHEIRHELAARTICDKQMVLYRRSDGEVTALEDACWHRLLPLSHGPAARATRSCAAITASSSTPTGRCTYMPAQKTINPSACVPGLSRRREAPARLGLARRSGARRSRLDPGLPLERRHRSGSGEGGTFYSLQCDYRLVVDNLMDLTHETYVHAGSIGDEAITVDAVRGHAHATAPPRSRAG